MRKALKEIKTDIKSLKKDIDDYKKETISHFDVVAENIHHDVAGANKDEISLIIQKQNLLEKKVRIVEQKVGV